MKALALRLIREEEGQDLIEYGLLVGLITAITIATITALGTRTQLFYTVLCDGAHLGC